MKKFDWEIKFKNKTWVLTLIAALFVLASTILKALGIDYDLTTLQDNVVAIVVALFSLLAVLGVVVNPNTSGITDPDDVENADTEIGTNENIETKTEDVKETE
jgi:phi LC3 family holin